MERDKEEQLIKSIRDYAAGFYHDCSRTGLAEAIVSILKSTAETHDYDKFVGAFSNTLYNKIYVEEEMWVTALVVGIVDIVLKSLDVQEEKLDFAPAIAMSGDATKKSENLRDCVIEQFNKLVISSGEPELQKYIIG